VACPDLVLTGAVETVGAMAQARPGFPAPARFFRVVLGVAGNDPRLRAGLTVRVSVLAARRERAVLVPRAAVRFDGATALCRVVRDGTASERRLRLGLANERHFEVLEGLDPGEAVALP
jgi:multidrug efflux pump subunit AcrA (membrane-fusion protein)